MLCSNPKVAENVTRKSKKIFYTDFPVTLTQALDLVLGNCHDINHSVDVKTHKLLRHISVSSYYSQIVLVGVAHWVWHRRHWKPHMCTSSCLMFLHSWLLEFLYVTDTVSVPCLVAV